MSGGAWDAGTFELSHGRQLGASGGDRRWIGSYRAVRGRLTGLV